MTNLRGRVAVFEKPGRPFQLQDVVIPPPKADELTVAVDLCTICGSDLHSIHGRRGIEGPLVLGHEVIGRVVCAAAGACDSAGTPWRPGDRVTWSIHASCGLCFFCRAGRSAKCERLFKYGHARSTAEYPCVGGFSSHCQIRAGTTVVRVPDELSDEVACPINCATSTVAAVFRQLTPVREKCVLILGAGMLGLTASAMARESQARSVVVMDPQPARAERALDFGGTHSVSTLAGAQETIQAITSGRGADVALDFSGNNEAVLAGIHFVRVGGEVVLAGSVFPTESITVSPERIVRNCLRITGVHNYEAADLESAVDFLQIAYRRYPFASLVQATYRLEEIEEAVACATSGHAVRVGIRSLPR